MDNYAAHKHANVKAWLDGNPRFNIHFTPTNASWMNMVECWFSMAERQAIHRGTYRSRRELKAKIRASIDGWNERCHPFAWTRTAKQLLAKATRKKTSVAEGRRRGPQQAPAEDPGMAHFRRGAGSRTLAGKNSRCCNHSLNPSHRCR